MITNRTQSEIYQFANLLNSKKKLDKNNSIFQDSLNKDIQGEIKNGYVKIFYKAKKVYQTRGRKRFNSSEAIQAIRLEHDDQINKKNFQKLIRAKS